jgi:hypothetical protein
MFAAWGVLLPLGVLVAATLRDFDPTWFRLHRGLNYAGLAAALAAWIVALVKLGPLNVGSESGALPSAHAVVGMLVMILGLLQPVNAILRPHKGEKYRPLWEIVHKTTGRVAWAGGLANVMVGIVLFRERDTCASVWPVIAYAVWLCVYVGGWIGLEFRARAIRHRSATVEELTAKQPAVSGEKAEDDEEAKKANGGQALVMEVAPFTKA